MKAATRLIARWNRAERVSDALLAYKVSGVRQQPWFIICYVPQLASHNLGTAPQLRTVISQWLRALSVYHQRLSACVHLVLFSPSCSLQSILTTTLPLIWEEILTCESVNKLSSALLLITSLIPHHHRPSLPCLYTRFKSSAYVFVSNSWEPLGVQRQ